jgi:DNA-binding MarR family transcriptional regulator
MALTSPALPACAGSALCCDSERSSIFLIRAICEIRPKIIFSMQPQELRTLKILEAVEQEGSPSQRELARRLNISLGLVNSFVKRLVNKGYFKVSAIPRNRVRYMLTPKGAAEKTRLTYEYIQFSLLFFKDARKKIRNVLSNLQREGCRTIAFYGAEELSEIAYISLQETEMFLIAVYDDNKAGKKFFGRTIEILGASSKREFDKIVVTVPENADRMASKIIEAGVAADKIAHFE